MYGNWSKHGRSWNIYLNREHQQIVGEIQFEHRANGTNALPVRATEIRALPKRIYHCRAEYFIYVLGRVKDTRTKSHILRAPSAGK